MSDDLFPNPNDAVMRLDGSIVRYQNEPYLCRVRKQAGCISLYSLTTIGESMDKPWLAPTLKSIAYTDPLLDMQSIHVGYINTDQEAYWIERAPWRKQKQGSYTGNMYLFAIGSRACNQIPNSILYSQHMQDALKGKYPRYDEIWAAGSFVNGVAISPEFCIRGEKLYYNQTWVGSANRIAADLRPSCKDSLLTMKLASLGVPV